MENTHLPQTVEALIQRLDELYPPHCIRPEDTLATAHRAAGRREVVEYLLYLQHLGSTEELDRHINF